MIMGFYYSKMIITIRYRGYRQYRKDVYFDK